MSVFVDATIREWSEELLRNLIAIPSAAGQSTEIGRFLTEVLDELDYTVEEVDLAVDPDHPEYTPVLEEALSGPALVARHRANDSKGSGYLLFAHSDTEAVRESWASHAHKMRVDDGRAYGIGAADSKAGIVSILAAVRALARAGSLPDAHPVLAFAPAKHGGSLGMMQAVSAARGVRRALYCHPAESGTGLRHIKVASRGVARVRVSFPGRRPVPAEERSPVSADPRTGHNAAYRAARFAASVPTWSDFASDPAAVWSVMRVHTVASRHFEIPDEAEVEVACWFTSGTVRDVHAFVENMAKRSAETPWEAEHEPFTELDGLRANPAENSDGSFTQEVCNTVADVCGVQPEPYEWHSASDIRFPMRLLGVPTLGLGALGGGFYGGDEWVDLASVHQVTETLTRILTSASPTEEP